MSIEHHGIVLPSSPEDRKRLIGAFDEILNCLAQIEAQQDLKKDIIQRIHEEFEIDKKIIAKAVSVIHKDNFQKVAAELDDLESLVELLTRSGS